jgi:two-component system, NtrC family, sensor kinase
VRELLELDSDIALLRKIGEDVTAVARDLDKAARDKTEAVIRASQLAILVGFPLFLAVGLFMLFLIGANVVRRLRMLIDVVERTGKGSYPHLSVPAARGKHADEVGVLMDKFNSMEDQLAQREEEIGRKNIELLRTRKLAAIGTLAAGVAHELNNPLNNIALSARALAREADEGFSSAAREMVSDILSQSARVKGIVSELLEFARGREPRKRNVVLRELLDAAHRKTAASAGAIRFILESEPKDVEISADPELLERVFINLFTNAAEAMPGGGELAVKIAADADSVKIAVSDTGAGMPNEALDKVFEPFFTTKDTGTGLGLAIVFSIIKKHKGELAVASVEGAGTTFTITLPKAP